MTAIQPKQLQRVLDTQPLAPFFWLHGDEPLLIQEAKDRIVAAGNKQGYCLRQYWSIEPHFDWQKLYDLCQNISLFDEKTLIILHNPDNLFDDAAKKALHYFVEKAPIQYRLLLITGKLPSAQQKTQWCSELLHKAVAVAIWPIAADQLPGWITEQLRHAALTADAESVHWLADMTTGNILATHQAIEKLKLLCPPSTSSKQTINLEQMMSAVADSARFELYDLGDQALLGKSEAVIKILDRLRQQNVEPILILWLLARELRTLHKMAVAVANGTAMTQVLSQQWASRRHLYQAAIKRLSVTTLETSLAQTTLIDQMIKGMAQGSYWDALQSLVVNMALAV